MYGTQLARTGAATLTVGGVALGAGWLMTAAVVLVEAGIRD